MKKYLLAFLLILITTTIAFPEESNNFYILPYLQNVTQNNITIMWWTDKSSEKNYVEYGNDLKHKKDGGNEYIPSVGKYLHKVVISGLSPDTYYDYRVTSDKLTSKIYRFHSAIKDEQNFSFAVLGDGRTDNDAVIGRHKKLVEMVLKSNANIAFEAGDMVETGQQLHWDRFWRQIVTETDKEKPGSSFASYIPYYLAVGNHEIYNGEAKEDTDNRKGNLTTSMARFSAYVDNPSNGSSNPSWEKRYYTVKYGVATFIILDTNNTSDYFYDNNKYLVSGSTPDWEPGSEQYLWMIEELKKAQENSAFTFIIMHPSPYCRSNHGDPLQSQSGWQVRALDTVFRKYGVDGILASHDHVVERCLTGPEGFEVKMDEKDPNNLNYIVMGNSGEGSRTSIPGWEKWMSVKKDGKAPYYTKYYYDWENTTHCSYLDVKIEKKSDRNWLCTFRIVRDDGKTFDEFSIERSEP